MVDFSQQHTEHKEHEMTDLYATADRYGVQFDGTLVGPAYHAAVDYTEQMTLKEVSDAKGKITRVRLLQEGLYCDISYIHATLPGGRIVNVRLTGPSHGIKRYELKKEFIEWAKVQQVFAKGIDLLNESVWSVLR
jgi:hypothetical protein